MPLALAGFQIDADQAVGEQVVAGAVAPVEVRGRRLDWGVGQAELFVDGDLAPDSGVAIDGPRFLQPSVVAEFARPWNGIELPKFFSGARVEREDHALGVVVRLGSATFAKRGAYQNNSTLGHGG